MEFSEWKKAADRWERLKQPRPVRRRQDGFSVDPTWTHERSEMARWLWDHADEILDVLRPPCPVCNGTATVDLQVNPITYPTGDTVYVVSDPCECAKTNHPGKAS